MKERLEELTEIYRCKFDECVRYILHLDSLRKSDSEIQLHLANSDFPSVIIEMAMDRYFYLDYANNFLTVDKFAAYHGISTQDALTYIKDGRIE